MSWRLALLGWLIGWAVVSLLMGLTLDSMAQDHEERSRSAKFRDLWRHSDGRAMVILALFISWPVLVPRTVRAVWEYLWTPRGGSGR